MSTKNGSISGLISFRLVSAFCFFIVAISAISITYEYIANVGYKFYLGKDGWSYLLELYDFPLKVIAAWVAAIGLISLDYRSIQTKVQIDLATEQNKFSNYYKHLEEFEKYIASLDPDSVGSLNARAIHNTLFPNLLETGNYLISKSVVSDLVMKMHAFFEVLGASVECGEIVESDVDLIHECYALYYEIRRYTCQDIGDGFHKQLIEVIESGWDDNAKSFDHMVFIIGFEMIKVFKLVGFDASMHSQEINNLQNVLINNFSQITEARRPDIDKASGQAIPRAYGRSLVNFENSRQRINDFAKELAKKLKS